MTATATHQWLIAVDLGASETRLRIVERAELRTVFDVACPTAHSDWACDQAALLELIRASIARADIVARCTTVTIGAAGIPDVFASRDLAVGLSSLGLAGHVIAADWLTAHIGAAGFQPGASIAAGTGVVGLATDLIERWHRVDGWGHLLGDDGGGAWIGRAGLNAALRAADGRLGASPALLSASRTRFGPVDTIVNEVASRSDRAATLATFAPDVFAAASSGDAVAIGIIDAAATRLAETIAATAEAPPGAHTVAYTGGLFAAGPLLLEPMRTRLAAISPVRVVAGRGTPLDGALVLAQTAATDPRQLPSHPHLIYSTGGQP